MDDLPQRRRDKRFQARLAIRARMGRKVHELVAEDVSYRGLFLITSAPPPLRQLIRLEAKLPPDDVPFVTHGMIVTVLPPGTAGRPAGCGVQFYGMGDERRDWEAFIRHVQRSASAVQDRRRTGEIAAATGGASPVEERPDGRRFHRSGIVIEVTPRNLDELFTMYSRDVSIGGMFLDTTRAIDIGVELRLDIRHPTGGSIFPLSAIVRRHSAEPPGLGVEFIGLDEQRRTEFFDFVHGFTDPGDPRIEIEVEAEAELEAELDDET